MEEITIYCPCCGKKLIIKNLGGDRSRRGFFLIPMNPNTQVPVIREK